MIQTILIEDERPALENLLKTTQEIDFPLQIKAVLPSVKQAISYFANTTHSADLILSDVQLTDGLSFNIFKEVEITTPVIFITGYDQFMMKAFENNGIDYLLKPVDKRELSKALRKYQVLQNHFRVHDPLPVQNLVQAFIPERRTRIMVKRGMEYVPVRFIDIVMFYTSNKVVYVLDKEGRKFVSDKSLSDLEQELDPKLFFRANRQYIINLEYIKSYKVFDKVKVHVDLLLPDIKHTVLISQETAPLFKKWIYES